MGVFVTLLLLLSLRVGAPARPLVVARATTSAPFSTWADPASTPCVGGARTLPPLPPRAPTASAP
ncbi:hypothetical protein PF007_g28765 [Phytophthora fragariae]|uniref:RxLR effector protein n=1 Tax=Phytophthora fragariae TaxID=53985 RepID=A0A6A4ASW3_9STRA|nr:hypothetical protein PF007_g28765 [Phytophthora fragariae]KAE9160424.1 hypothetical protein PF004_g31186 [Phytophthora fragariae]KAE9263357.1 hypothetical protein PF001_g31714 [Phytophthora fragariae]